MARPIAALLAAFATCACLPAWADEPPWDANTVELARETVAPGVHVLMDSRARAMQSKGVALGTTAGVIVGTRASLIVDTMLNRRLALRVLGEAAAQLGGTPTYAVNTSHHGDHAYGNMYLPRRTVVIQHEATSAYLAAHFDEDAKAMVGLFGRGRGIEQVHPRLGDVLVPKGGVLRLDLGDKQVEIRDFGFAQTGGDLFVWLPAEKVLFTGNPVVAGKPGLPWLADGHVQETLETLTRVRDFLPEDAIVVPGHGHPLRRVDLDWPIRYLTALRDETRMAIARGASLEETVEAAKLPEFEGYALFDRVHRQLNLPKAYAEFKAQE